MNKRLFLFSLIGGLCIGILAAVLFVGCHTAPERIPQARIVPAPGTGFTGEDEAAYVIAHSGEALGIERIPVWLQIYIASGITGIESLPDYEAFYCFVLETRNGDPQLLDAWFNVNLRAKNISLLAAERLDRQFLRLSANKPGIYGGYYPVTLAGVQNAVFHGVQKINEWWVLGRFRQPGTAEPAEEYRGYILYIVEKQILDNQIREIMRDVMSPATPEEQTAVERIKYVFEREGLS
jgi:hypothetical protein